MWMDHFEVMSQALARHLAALDAVLLLEGLDSTEDPLHPVTDAQMDGNLVAFALQKNRSRREVQLPWGTLVSTAERFGFPLAPTTAGLAWAEVDGLLARCRDWLYPGPAVEGWVLVLARPGEEQHVIRLKVKTRQYTTRRQLRTILSGVARDGWPHVAAHWEGMDAFQRAVVSWAAAQYPEGLDFDGNVCAVVRAFEASIGGAGMCWLVEHMRRDGGPAAPAAAHWLVLPVGLPGCGKTTFLHKLAHALQSHLPVVYLSRDETAAELMVQFTRRSGRPALPRDVQKDTHCLLRGWLKAVPKAATSPSVIILDACNASPAARREMATAARVGRLLLLLFHPSDESDSEAGLWAWLWKHFKTPPLKIVAGTAAPGPAPPPLTPDHVRRFIARVESRRGHPLLAGSAAEPAVRAVFSGLQFPTDQEVVALAGALPGCRVERCAVDPFGRFDPVAQQLAGHILAGARPPLPPPPHGLRLKELPPAPPCHGVFTARRFLQRHTEAEAALFEALGLVPAAHAAAAKGRQVVQVRPQDGRWAELARQAMAALVEHLGAGDTAPTAKTPAEVEVESVQGNTKWFQSWVAKAPLSEPGLSSPLPPGLAGSGSPDFQQRLLRLWDVPRHLPDLHLTLLVRPARQFTAADQQYCAKLQAEGWADAEVEVLVHRMLFDYKGLCWDVTGVRRRPPDGSPDAEELPPRPVAGPAPGAALHVTLGTVGSVKPVYCGSMPGNVDRWLEVWLGAGRVDPRVDSEAPAAKRQRGGNQREGTPDPGASPGDEAPARLWEEADGACDVPDDGSEEDREGSEPGEGPAALSRKKRKRAARQQGRSTFLIANFRRPIVLRGRLTVA
eukprot:EG_transcript_1812